MFSFDIPRSFHDTQQKHYWVRTQDKYIGYHEYFYPVRPSTTHQLGATPHSNRASHPRSKSDFATPTSIDNCGNTLDPIIIATNHS